ncbi:hypothetical protein PPSIR1_35777 [Plesiocystis pacifica SIR-1]|uniref:Uncharacterized protein n=1 Tax=Plesiocystis pacifica SIR-1 TaxID=391625 RepID=A6G1T4_9BACT|nr:hypothetical protein [Plesiocystis pacifica]EDM80124.1 hypothetical protein PPSIR1_35777 [Plesiocystis pacifica SIR-1]
MNAKTLLPKPMLARVPRHDDSLVLGLDAEFAALEAVELEPAPAEGRSVLLIVDELVDELTALADALEISLELTDEDPHAAQTVTDGVAEVA